MSMRQKKVLLIYLRQMQIQTIGTIKYLGKDYPIKVDQSQWVEFKFAYNEFRVNERLAKNFSKIEVHYNKFCKQQLKKVVDKYMRQLSNKTIAIPITYTNGTTKIEYLSVNKYLQKVGYRPCKYEIDNYAGAWGINEPVIKNKQFVLHFNLSLIKYDTGEKIGYVVAHELAHIFAGGHGRDFQAMVDKLYPGSLHYERFWNTR